MNPQIKFSMGSSSSTFCFVLVGLMLTCSVLLMTAYAVAPPPDGAYPGNNTAEGQNALFSLTSGRFNTAVGSLSLKSDISGSGNTAIGAGTLLVNTADENTATGLAALLNNTTGTQNTANGALALLNNTTGTGNAALGVFSLFNNTEGSNNTANGLESLFTNRTGQGNTAAGAQALFFNDGDPTNNEGSYNSAFGDAALFGNTTGYANSAFGWNALVSNATGGLNTAVGDEALFNNIDGFSNTGVGFEALANNTSGFQNTAVGDQALINCNTGSGNTAIGLDAGVDVTTASNVICIGSVHGENIDNSCYIANVYSNIQPVIGTDPDYVTITSTGRLGRSNFNGSSRRFKHHIQPMDKTSEVIFALNPVTFEYNKEYDAMQRRCFGLIAEDVAEIAPDLVGRNKQGEPESVRYEQINAMLLNEFLKEHKKVHQLEASLADQRRDFRAAIAELKKETDMKIQEATAQIELNKTASTIAVKDLVWPGQAPAIR